VIEVVGVTQHYGVRPILHDVSLRVAGGELVALMGPNGMGKSTLLSVMAGILSPQKGHVEIDGVRRRSSAEAELHLPRSFGTLLEIAHFPLLAMPLAVFLSAHLFAMCPLGRRRWSGLIAAITFTWYGVNYILAAGLHSYGFGNGGETFYFLYLIAELLFVTFFLAKNRLQKKG